MNMQNIDDIRKVIREEVARLSLGWRVAGGDEFARLADRHAAWSRRTFGEDADRGPLGPLRHMAREVEECIVSPADRGEYADLLLLLLDASRRAGVPAADLVAAGHAKMDTNQLRSWRPPAEADQAVEHRRTPEELYARFVAAWGEYLAAEPQDEADPLRTELMQPVPLRRSQEAVSGDKLSALAAVLGMGGGDPDSVLEAAKGSIERAAQWSVILAGEVGLDWTTLRDDQVFDAVAARLRQRDGGPGRDEPCTPDFVMRRLPPTTVDPLPGGSRVFASSRPGLRLYWSLSPADANGGRTFFMLLNGGGIEPGTLTRGEFLKLAEAVGPGGGL